jgi:hypothetical protein
MVEWRMLSRRSFATLVGGLIAGGIVLALLIVLVLAPRCGDGDAAPPTATEAEPAPRWAAPAEVPPGAFEPTRSGVAGLPDPEWLAVVAAETGIPPRALAAYAGAAIAKNGERPDCDLGWNTLAGIGWVESRHGSYGGASIAEDGTVSPSIIGIALDGSTTALIPDTDDGAIDGDAEFDRAVGPMQFIPGQLGQLGHRRQRRRRRGPAQHRRRLARRRQLPVPRDADARRRGVVARRHRRLQLGEQLPRRGRDALGVLRGGRRASGAVSPARDGHARLAPLVSLTRASAR